MKEIDVKDYITKNPLVEKVLGASRKFFSDSALTDDIRPIPSLNINSEQGVNAFACKINGRYEISISIGTLIVLRALFDLMLSNSNVFLSIGNAAEEISQEKVFNAEITSINELHLVFHGNTVLRPRDKQRAYFSDILFTNALNFLIYHEYIHIISGHLDYLANEKSISYVGEHMESEKSSNPENLEFHIMEFDSDCMACQNALNEIFGIYVSSRSGNIEFDDVLEEQHYTSIAESLYAVYLSQIILFRMFGSKSELICEDFLKYKHPIPAIRFNIAASSTFFLSHVFPERYGEFGGFIRETAVKSIRDTEQAFVEISQQALQTSFLKEALEGCRNEHAMRILSEWNVFKHKLTPYKLNSMLAYDYTSSLHDLFG